MITLPGTVVAEANSWELVPEKPVAGDMIEIRGVNFTGDKADVLVSFERDVSVSEGRYEYLIENVEISPGFKNSFSVQAKGAEDLNVRVKMILWISRSAKAKGGVAEISQSGIPPGTYQIRIDGKSNASEVKLKITGNQEMEVNSGNFSYKYNTESIPAGNFEVKVGNTTKQVVLQPAESLPSSMANLSNKKENSKKDFSGDWKAWGILVGGFLTGALLIFFYSKVKNIKVKSYRKRK